MSGGRTSNGDMGVRVGRDADMMLYDQLPAPVRRAMQEAWFDYASEDMRMALADCPADAVAAMIHQSDVNVAHENPPR